MSGLLINAEREQLDHQKSRLEQILAADMVSATMRGDLQQLLEDIGRRLHELSQPGGAGNADRPAGFSFAH
jgi:hypothetical protein